jgi:2-dehydropantoate 2-reductase
MELVVLSPLGDVRPQVSTLTEAQPGFQAVLACKAYALDSAIDAVALAVTADTLVLPLLKPPRFLTRRLGGGVSDLCTEFDFSRAKL